MGFPRFGEICALIGRPERTPSTPLKLRYFSIFEIRRQMTFAKKKGNKEHLRGRASVLDVFLRAFDKRGIIPPKTLTKRGGELFADGDVGFHSQIDSKSKSTAFVVLPGLLPIIQSFFFFFSRVYSR